MSRFRIDHPHRTDLHAEAGHDAMLGFYVDIMKGQRVIKSYDFFSPMFTRARPLLGALDFLVAEGFFTADDLHEALAHVQDDTRVPKRLARAVEVIVGFREAE